VHLSTIVGLLQNAALLLALGVLYDLLGARSRSRRLDLPAVITGLALGGIGIAVMLTRWEFGNGVVFDTRSVLLGVAGFFLGTVPTAIAVIITAAFRLIQGGAGAWTGVGVIVTSAALGLGWRWARRRKPADAYLWELYLFGVVVHAAMLLWMLTLPQTMSGAVLRAIGLPVMLIYPFATALLGRLLANHEIRRRITEELRESEARYRNLSTGLEELVRARTAELDQRLTEIRALNEAMTELLAESHRANQRLLATQNELQEANAELESFAYSVSHDLRAPLRAIDGFSQILVEEWGSWLPEQAQHYLGVVRRNAVAMGQLITDLLRFSRLSRQPLERCSVAIDPLVREVLGALLAEEGERQVEVVLGDLQPCQADAPLLQQVWTNLLSNALKYTRSREVARIEIGCEKTDRELVYSVRDNGVGFDMEYVDKLFGVFQRLHRSEDYEGTGVGLAIVQRIVRRHGGRVWAEAEQEGPEAGATFFFTIPAPGDASPV